jgi:hypothetical protein
MANVLLANELNFLKTSASSNSDSGHRQEDLDQLSDLYRANRSPLFVYALVACMVIGQERHITRAIAAFLRTLRSHSAVRAFAWFFPQMNAYQIAFAVYATEVMRDHRLMKLFHRVILTPGVAVNAKCVCCEHIGSRMIAKMQYAKLTGFLKVCMRGEVALRFSCICVVLMSCEDYRPHSILRTMLKDEELKRHSKFYDQLFGFVGEEQYFEKLSARLRGKETIC